MANNPTLYNKNVQSGHATIPDSIGDILQPRYVPQQIPLDVSQYYASPPPLTMNDQRYEPGLSLDNILKIGELKRLVNKYPQYHTNPDGIIRLAIYNSINGDNKPLDEKLEQLRRIDSQTNIRF
ncbi:MAG: hypothetical protein WBF33_01990 [Candidatus Nitrosopolaris sp.]|jgi:hypothetical protein